MPMVVYSPYSGKSVKVRDQDVGRAIRDEEGRIFYVVERSDGQGYYASPTRQGSEKDEQRYLDMISKSAAAEQTKRAETSAPAHDATGKGRGSPVGKLVGRLVVLLVILFIIYAALAYTGYLPDAVPNVLPTGNGATPTDTGAVRDPSPLAAAPSAPGALHGCEAFVATVVPIGGGWSLALTEAGGRFQATGDAALPVRELTVRELTVRGPDMRAPCSDFNAARARRVAARLRPDQEAGGAVHWRA